MVKNKNFISRLRFSLHGIFASVKNERSFRTQVIMAGIAILVLTVLGASPLWWAIFLFLIMTILAFELMNTALENLIDRVHEEHHEQIGLAKDCASGVVLLVSFISIVVFVIFLYDKFWLGK